MGVVHCIFVAGRGHADPPKDAQRYNRRSPLLRPCRPFFAPDGAPSLFVFVPAGVRAVACRVLAGPGRFSFLPGVTVGVVGILGVLGFSFSSLPPPRLRAPVQPKPSSGGHLWPLRGCGGCPSLCRRTRGRVAISGKSMLLANQPRSNTFRLARTVLLGRSSPGRAGAGNQC